VSQYEQGGKGMDNWQLLLGVNTILLVLLGFFIKMWIGGIKTDIASVKADLKDKADVEICRLTHEGVDKLLHRHATVGTAGEAVYK
jgi:hypothetical protein